MAKKKKEEEHENLERWLVSYADFITLLFAFFVTMYAMSRVDEQKLGSAVESLQRALGSVISVQTPSSRAGVFNDFSNPMQVTIVPIGAPNAKEVKKLAEDLKKKIEGAGGKGAAGKGTQAYQLSLLVQERGLVIRVSDQFFFRTGEAAIRPEVLPLLEALGQTLQPLDNPIRIEGHTDNVPINTAQFPSNWELSTARATTIIRYLLTHFKFDPQKLSAAGYGEHRPVASNESLEGRNQNRRVDVVVLNSQERKTEPAAFRDPQAGNPPTPAPKKL
ncbi:MAG: OmpA family protein [Deltaproteobacteria bacterium]|nr:OmpA family protein [Deltaproteobacteria bacterium]